MLHSAERDDREQTWRALRDWFGMELYVKFDIGTPGQTMNLIVDSGSDWFWINSVDCDACGGKDKHDYDPDLSSTEVFHGGKWKNVTLRYGSGDAKGVQMRETICLRQSDECLSNGVVDNAD